ncbi:MAG: putative depolymerase, partial [Myxococcales bacterium]|nr:putative depolymerase [Myxococcales bacterium]
GSTGTGGAVAPPAGRSVGCGKDIGAGDTPGTYAKRNITVTGVTFAKPATPGGSWTNRIYYLDLPAKYDPTKAYPIHFGGGGCGGSIGNGSGAFKLLPENNTDLIQIGLSYVWPNPGGACFADGYADTPDLPYFDSILKEVETNYCVNTGKVFVGGYSSGAWEAYMLGFARGGVVRGISPAAGGLRAMADRPPAANKPFAAFMVTGANDTANPATGATGSMAARDLILQINGCTGTATADYPAYVGGGCLQYTGCPTDYPVIYCRPPGQGHTDGGANFWKSIWALWMSLK